MKAGSCFSSLKGFDADTAQQPNASDLRDYVALSLTQHQIAVQLAFQDLHAP